MDKKTLESLIRRVLLEELGQRAHGVKKLALPEETVTEANRLDTGRPGDFVYTKDLGYISQDGYVYVLGRADDIINFKGIKIAPEEIEETARSYRKVVDCA